MQNWNDVLEYIKINLGGQINLIEIKDDDIVEMLKNQVLTYFSQFTPDKKYLMVNSQNLINSVGDNRGQPRFRYNLPVSDDEYIVDIFDAYTNSSENILNTFSYNYNGAIDTVIANTYIDALKSIQVRNTWEFHPPKEIIFDMEIRSAVIVYNTTHSSLETIRPDLYQMMFKPLCLANVKLWISSMRSKYAGLQTPFGTLELNWQALQQEGMQEKESVMQMIQTIPPDHLVHVSV